MRYYGRDGKEITLAAWCELIEKGGDAARRVGETRILGGLVSTVLLGLDHQFSRGGPPLIFETMVFLDESKLEDRDCERYSTLLQAIEGHARMVAKWKYGVPKDPEDRK